MGMGMGGMGMGMGGMGMGMPGMGMGMGMPGMGMGMGMPGSTFARACSLTRELQWHVGEAGFVTILFSATSKECHHLECSNLEEFNRCRKSACCIAVFRP